MDQSALSHFTAKFAALDRDELGDLVARRGDLSDEAMAALDKVLVQQGLSAADVCSPPAPAPATSEGPEVDDTAKKTKLAKELWKGGLATFCSYQVAMICLALAQRIARSLSLGGLWTFLAVLVAGLLGYQIGRSVTRTICANADVSIAQKTKTLWWFFALMWPAFLIIFAISSAVFRVP